MLLVLVCGDYGRQGLESTFCTWALGDLYNTGLLGPHPLGLANCVNMSESGEWIDTAPLSLVAGFLGTG